MQLATQVHQWSPSLPGLFSAPHGVSSTLVPGVGVPGHHRKPAAGEAKGYIGISYFLGRFFDSLRIIWHYCTLIDPSGSSGVESDTFSLSDPSLLFQFPGEQNSWHPGRRLPVNWCKCLLSACAPPISRPPVQDFWVSSPQDFWGCGFKSLSILCNYNTKLSNPQVECRIRRIYSYLMGIYQIGDF